MNLAGNSLLSVVTFLPATVAIFMCFLNAEAKQNARWIALWTTLFTFALSLLVWINFDPAHSQVTIDLLDGTFDGYAWSENLGWIHFRNDAPAYAVQTTARMPRGAVFIIR